jgi:negative regulator of flagellin synthesis FlgM
MKIPYIGKNDLKVSENPVKPSRSAGKEAAKTGEVRQDRIRLSRDAQKLLEMEKTLKASDPVEVRAELVERLRSQIQEGAYKPDSRKVAEKMIAEAATSLGED